MNDNKIKQPVLKAGGVIIDNDNRVLLLYQARTDDWTFPKGHIDDGESPEVTALRETHEETGLSPIILRELPILIYTNRLGLVAKTYMYLMKCEDDKDLKEYFKKISVFIEK